jgi:hypothetical protein
VPEASRIESGTSTAAPDAVTVPTVTVSAAANAEGARKTRRNDATTMGTGFRGVMGNLRRFGV